MGRRPFRKLARRCSMGGDSRNYDCEVFPEEWFVLDVLPASRPASQDPGRALETAKAGQCGCWRAEARFNGKAAA